MLFFKRLVPILVLGIIVGLIFFFPARAGKLTVAFLDVGQGDSIFITGPTGVQLLIDGGAGPSVLRGLSSQMPFYDRTIDYVIATHPDQDHIGGLVDVVERYVVRHYLESGVQSDSPAYHALEGLLEHKQVTRGAAYRVDVLDLGGGAYARILFPDRAVVGLETNTASVVLQVVYGDHEFLLTGDAPKSIEKYLVSLYGGSLLSDVLKLGHHGSNTSSEEEFIDVVSPTYAVVSAGKDNRYGHPHQEVVERVRQKNIPLFSTAEEGTIIFVSDGAVLKKVGSR